MYPDTAFYEFYPAEIVKQVLQENPNASVEELNRLMEKKWNAIKPRTRSMAELADELGL